MKILLKIEKIQTKVIVSYLKILLVFLELSKNLLVAVLISGTFKLVTRIQVN